MVNMQDEFTTYYNEFLDSNYNCVDRIVLNAYCKLAQSSGGFRTLWRQIYGSDKNLNNSHLMRMAGRLSRRIRAYAKKRNIPIIFCQHGERKHELAEQHISKDPNFRGVFLILINRAPASVWDIQCSKRGSIKNIAKKNPLPYVNHYSFHIIDPEWGHITIRLCGHAPFNAQIILNGHEYVERKAKKTDINFTKVGNCFTNISDAPRLTDIAETLCSEDTIGRLKQVCERWIYSACLCFALDLSEQERCGFRYSYSVYQGEYSRNMLFTRGTELDQIFHGVINRTYDKLSVKELKTILGTKNRPYHRAGLKPKRQEIVVERPTYNMTVFKIHFGRITAKCYTKGERVLRIEVIIHNARKLPCGCSLEKFPQIISHLKGILNRFLDALHCMDTSIISDARLDELPCPTHLGNRRISGIDVNKPRMRRVIKGVIELSIAPYGFTASDLADKVNSISCVDGLKYTPRMASYDLQKLLSKNILHKKERARRYKIVTDGLKALTALLVLRENVIKPVLAGAGKVKCGPKPKYISSVDSHYRNLQQEMYSLFQTLKIAA